MTPLNSPAAWGLLAGLTGIAGYVPYLRDAWRRASDPDPAAWLIWTVEYGVLLAAQAAQHPPWPALCLAALQLAGTIAVFTLLAARGGWHFGAGRWTMLGCAAAVMTLWRFTHAPGPALVLIPFLSAAVAVVATWSQRARDTIFFLMVCLAVVVEGAGMILVMLNAYRRPGSETVVTWWAFLAGGLLDLPALAHSPWLLYAYPAFFIAMSTAVLMAAAAGRRAAAAAAWTPAGAQGATPARASAETSGTAPAKGTTPAGRSAKPQGDLPGDRQRARLPVEGPRQPRAGKRPEEYRQRAR